MYPVFLSRNLSQAHRFPRAVSCSLHPMTLEPPPPGLSGKVIAKAKFIPSTAMSTLGGGRREEVLYKTHVIATILVILDISCMFVTMVTDSAGNLVCWALGSSITAMWCQFGPLGAFLSLCLSPPAPVCLFIFVSVCPQPVSGPVHFLLPRNSCSCVPALPTPGPASAPPGQSLTKDVPEWTGRLHPTGKAGGWPRVEKGLSQPRAVGLE